MLSLAELEQNLSIDDMSEWFASNSSAFFQSMITGQGALEAFKSGDKTRIRAIAESVSARHAPGIRTLLTMVAEGISRMGTPMTVAEVADGLAPGAANLNTAWMAVYDALSCCLNGRGVVEHYQEVAAAIEATQGKKKSTASQQSEQSQSVDAAS